MVKILIIGELCTDVYVYGDVNRLSPEAPIPVINPIRYVKNAGMAGNVYQNVLSLVENSEVKPKVLPKQDMYTRKVTKCY